MPICAEYVHDSGVFLWQHPAKFVLHAQQGAEHVGIERRRVAFRSLLGHGAGCAFGASAVDSDIQAAKSFHRLVDQIAYVFFSADIGADELRFRTGVTDFTDELLAFFVAPAGNDNLSAFPGKREGRRASDARQSTGNQNNLGSHGISPCKTSPLNSESEAADDVYRLVRHNTLPTVVSRGCQNPLPARNTCAVVLL